MRHSSNTDTFWLAKKCSQKVFIYLLTFKIVQHVPFVNIFKIFLFVQLRRSNLTTESTDAKVTEMSSKKRTSKLSQNLFSKTPTEKAFTSWWLMEDSVSKVKKISKRFCRSSSTSVNFSSPYPSFVLVDISFVKSSISSRHSGNKQQSAFLKFK